MVNSKYYKKKEEKKPISKEENAANWKKAEIGAAWKRQTKQGKDFYFLKIKLNRFGINEELLIKGYRNSYQTGSNPPTMMLYCFENDNPWLEELRNDPNSPLSIDLGESEQMEGVKTLKANSNAKNSPPVAEKEAPLMHEPVDTDII